MTGNVGPRPRTMSTRRSFAIVASEYNPELVQALVTSAAAKINELSTGATVVLYQVPGAFEIPVIVQELARNRTYHAIIALGVIIFGETEHGPMIARTVTDSLQRLSLEHRIPVIHEVITAPNAAIAKERCMGVQYDRGAEAARAAVEMAQLMTDVGRRETPR